MLPTTLLLTVLSLAGAGRAAAEVPACIGDCNANRQVTVDELVRGVNIALGAQAVETCTAFDRNENLAVTIDELIAGVNAALQGCFPPVVFRGACVRPGAGGLVPCAPGAPVRISVCLDRTRCLFDPTARRLLDTVPAAADGRFTAFISDEALLDALLLLESDVAPGSVYRTFAFGPSGPGVILNDLDLTPVSEALLRLINLNGLALFSDAGLRELYDIIRAALSALTFAGLSADAAALLATDTATQDPTVAAAIDARRFTPAPTATRTHTPTIALTATSTPTATSTLSPTTTLTPSASPTASATRTITLTPSATATPSPSASATRTATATASATITSTPTPTRTPTATLPPLNLAVEVNPDPVRPGETAEVSFTVTNTGGSPLGPISLAMVLPQNIQPFIDLLASGTGRCGPNQINTCDPGSTLTWNFIGSLAPGEGITLRVPPIVAPGTPNGTELVFSGTAGAPGLSAMRSTTAVVQSGISFPYDLALTPDADPVVPSALLTYTVAYGFRAVVGQADTRLSLALPEGVSLVSASDGGDLVDGAVEWALGSLTPGDGGMRRVTVQVDAALPVGALLEAQAHIRRADGSGAKRATAVGHARAVAPIGIALEAGPDPARPGDNIEVGVTLTNPSDTARTVLLDFVVPDLVDPFTDGTVMGGGTCGPFTPGSVCERRARVRWSLVVPPRDGLTVRADPIVAMGAPNGSIIQLQARLVDTQGSYVASARGAVRIDAGTIWDLRLEEDRDPVAPAEVYTYRLTARHRPSDPTPVDAVLDLVLPSGVSVLDAGDDALVGNGTVQWPLGVLVSNAVTSRSVTVQVENDTPAASVLAAEAVLRDAANPLSATRSRILTRTALGTPLALSLVVLPDPVRRGQALETEMIITNTGATTLGGAMVEARLPEGTDAFFASLSTGAACSNVTLQCAPREVARWNTSLIPPGQSATVRMPPIVGNATGDGSLLRLHVRAGLGSVSPTVGGRDSMLSRTIVVDGATPFDLALIESQDPTLPGQMLDYTLHFGRPAAGAADDAVLRLHLPPGVFFVSSADGGVPVGDDAVEWELGALAAGDGGSRTATVVVDALLEGTALHARATLREGDDATTEKRAEAVTVVGVPPIAFAVSAAPAVVAPGGVVTVTLSVTNHTGVAINNVSVEGIVPTESNGLVDNTTTGGGVCGPFSFNTCAPRTRVIWNIPTVGAGQTVSVTMPPPLRADLAPGSVVRVLGRLQQNISTPPLIASDAVTVQTP